MTCKSIISTFHSFLNAAKISVRPSEGAAEGGCGGNSAAPERNQKEASPAALLVQSRTPQKSFLFLLEEKIGRAQNQKCRENFFVGWQASARGGGAASIGWFRSGISDKMSSSQTVKTHIKTQNRLNAGFVFRDYS